MTDNIYRDLREKLKQKKRPGSFPFPTYAEALFSSTLISKKPIQSILSPKKEMPKEKEELVNSLANFIEEFPEKEIIFEGGKVSKKAEIENKQEVIHEVSSTNISTGIGLQLLGLNNIDEIEVVFLGTCPKDFDIEGPNRDLLSKMISAMKLKEGTYCRIFFSDNEIIDEQWSQFQELVSSWSDKKRVLITLGAQATNLALGKKERLSRVHGKEFQLKIKGKDRVIQFSLFPVFHPDILVINPNMKRSAWLDLQKIMNFISQG